MEPIFSVAATIVSATDTNYIALKSFLFVALLAVMLPPLLRAACYASGLA
jgi:hypothetical protein